MDPNSFNLVLVTSIMQKYRHSFVVDSYVLLFQDTDHDENNEASQPSIDMAKGMVETKEKGDQHLTSISKPGGKQGKQGSQGSDPPKEEYIHVRARRGQATNSHSLAERVRIL